MPLVSDAATRLGFNPARLKAAATLAQTSEIDWPRDLAQALEQGVLDAPPYNIPRGPVAVRGGTNGLVLRHGETVVSWGNIERPDFTFSVAKSYLALLAGIAIGDGLIGDVHDTVRSYALDPSFDEPQNQSITWHHLLQQTSEWEGTLFGLPDLVDRNRDVGSDGDNARKGQHRDLRPPGTFWEYNDVRVNRLSLSLLQLFKKPLPDVLKGRIMDPIGASDTWRWYGYDDSAVLIDGRPMTSVPGGTHWGGGICINSADHARVGQLVLQHGNWQGRQLIPSDWIERLWLPCDIKADYGYLWWLNTAHCYSATAPVSSVFAMGAGGNLIWILEERDIVVVARWLNGAATDAVIGAIMESIV